MLSFRPGLAAILRNRKPYFQLAGVVATGNGIVVVGHGEVCGVARSAPVNADPRDEMVHCAGNRIDRDAGNLGPRRAIGGGAQDEVVGAAARTKAAIRPHDIDFSLAINLCRGHTEAVAQSPIFPAEVLVADDRSAGPTLATVGRTESDHGA